MTPSPPWDAVRVEFVWAYEGSSTGARGRSLCDRALFLTAWLVLRGSARVEHHGQSTLALPGEWLFPRPVVRMQEFAPGTRLLSLALRAEWPDGRALFDGGQSLTLPAASHPALARQARLLLRRSHERETLAGHFAFREALYGWARTLSETLTAAGLDPRRAAHADERLATLLQRLDTCPLTELRPGERLARELGVSRVQFERLCAAALGRTSRQYLEERRLDYARRTLPFKLAKEVAAETGFSHVSTFSAWFKRKTGAAPTLAV